MGKSWKMFERKMCEELSSILFGVVKPVGGRVDKDCPLCRADDSGAHPSALRPGDVVPNGLWIRKGWLVDLDSFSWVIELKYVPGIDFDLIISSSKNRFFKYWQQAYDQADSFGANSAPVLIVNKEHTSHKYMITDPGRFRLWGRANLPKNHLLLRRQHQPSIMIFTLKEFEKVNPIFPFNFMIKRP